VTLANRTGIGIGIGIGIGGSAGLFTFSEKRRGWFVGEK